jgi:hypothetical protein
MRHTILNLWFLFSAAALWAQPPSVNKVEKAAIQRARQSLVSSFDRSLPRVSLEFFLKYEGEGAPIKWEVNDCGEQTGNPAVDDERDSPMCVEANMNLKDRRTVTVLVSVGTFKSGLVGLPALFSATILDQNGLVRPLCHLSDLPAELHRPPPKLPRDLPTPVG